MNDIQIRQSFHDRKLRAHHSNPKTLVINELGLKHGKCRADIAVINGHLTGYEIKSEFDTLRRLDDQIQTYSKVFDYAVLVLTQNHLKDAREKIPNWWGIILASPNNRGNIKFEVVREKTINPQVDGFSVAQLLWQNEAKEILLEIGAIQGSKKYTRTVLCQKLSESMTTSALGLVVRNALKSRRTWRHHWPPSPNDDLSPFDAK